MDVYTKDSSFITRDLIHSLPEMLCSVLLVGRSARTPFSTVGQRQEIVLHPSRPKGKGKRRWCAECGRSKGVKGVVPLQRHKMCEECNVKVKYRPNAKPWPLLCVGICAQLGGGEGGKATDVGARGRREEAKGGGGLQSKSKRAKSGASCPYHVPAEAPESLDYRNQVLAAVSDIEDLRSLGKTHGVCPYYGSRRALGLAQIVTMPYSTLMHRRTRETLGLRLKGNVIIIDEAHNLVDAINNVHSSIVTLAHIGLALSQLTQYKDRYQARLNPKNLFYVNQLVAILKGFVKYLGVKKKKKNTNKNHNNNTREEEEEERRKRRKGGEGIDVSSLSSSASSSRHPSSLKKREGVFRHDRRDITYFGFVTHFE